MIQTAKITQYSQEVWTKYYLKHKTELGWKTFSLVNKSIDNLNFYQGQGLNFRRVGKSPLVENGFGAEIPKSSFNSLSTIS